MSDEAARFGRPTTVGRRYDKQILLDGAGRRPLASNVVIPQLEASSEDSLEALHETVDIVRDAIVAVPNPRVRCEAGPNTGEIAVNDRTEQAVQNRVVIHL